MSGTTYKDAGVDIDAGANLVEAIKPLAAGTRRSGSDNAEDGGLGGFGGLFDLKAAGFKDPVLVAATDGVGTKLAVAQETGIHDTIGIDLVAMCVNDLVVQGAEPLFFLDYYATGKLAVDAATDVVRGIAEGCRQAGCALIGGETAEMPGLYQGEDYDLAGFSVGAVERGRALDGSAVQEGDIILGMASSGVHSNGFSLVRKVIADLGLNYLDPAPFGDADDTGQSGKTSLGQALLAPTKIYVKSSLAALRKYANRAAHENGVRAFAHITGGGLTENLPRVLPAGLSAQIDAAKWSQPAIFPWLARAGKIAPEEMFRTFNCGIGMVVIVAPDQVELIKSILEENGETIYNIGQIKNLDKSGEPVPIDNMTSQYR